jgi:hypothetical protein
MLTSPTVEVQVGIQYSSDGIVWDTAAPLNFATGAFWLSASVSWQFATDRYACPGDFSGPPTEKLFVRFGLWVNNLSGSKAMMGMAQLAVSGGRHRVGLRLRGSHLHAHRRWERVGHDGGLHPHDQDWRDRDME